MLLIEKNNILFFKSDRIRVDEPVDLLEGKSEEEMLRIIEERETQKRATVLQIIGDIPDADVKPPENVLFVCKLNQITSDEDLELIFSRFGPIRSCEVIRDRVTGESLCYAFIEFENEEDCENAYFKMDNVLIDDRRIHVDFSQSVSKVVWKGKGTGTGYFKNINDKDEVFDDNGGDRDDRARNDYKIKNKSRKGEGYDLLIDGNDDTKINSKYFKMDKNRRSDDNYHYSRDHRDYRRDSRERYHKKHDNRDDYERRKHRDSFSRDRSRE